MDNYKIKVNEANCKEVQDLFFELGYRWCALSNNVSYLQRISSTAFTHLVAWSVGSCKNVIQLGCGAEEATELTLPQLRDIVVLHRNDVKDATHKNTKENLGFLCSDGAEYFWNFGTKKWFKPENMTFKNKKMKPLHKEAEQGLISGADALRALADGKEVEYLGETKTWFSLNKETSAWSLTEVLTATDLKEGTSFKFRLKPRTIKLELEIPAPFEPKLGEIYYFITTSNSQGFDFTEFDDSDGDKLYMQLGAYRSASDAKKAVAVLRGIKA